MKDNVIIVGDFNRKDFLYAASIIHECYNIYFLEFTNREEITSNHYKDLGKAIFWGEFKNAIELIDKIKPIMVLFYFIETYNHVALNVACKYKGVKTFHIEHGIRDYEMLQANIDKINDRESLTFRGIVKKVKTLRSRLLGRLFFQSTVATLPVPYNRFLKHFFQVRNSKSIFETFKAINDPLRVADNYISFSSKIFEFHRISDHLPESYPVFFIGCPSFDYLVHAGLNASNARNILFIDNAFEVQNMFGWSEEYKVELLQKLKDFAKGLKRRLLVKSHPYANQKVYKSIEEDENVSIIKNEDELIRGISESKIIIGFYSTLLMPLMAMDHTVCFSLEMHPDKLDKKPSSFLVESGAINEVNSWDALDEAINNLDEIYKIQTEHKKSFIAKWMYKFDGHSSDRLKNILINEVH